MPQIAFLLLSFPLLAAIAPTRPHNPLLRLRMDACPGPNGTMPSPNSFNKLSTISMALRRRQLPDGYFLEPMEMDDFTSHPAPPGPNMYGPPTRPIRAKRDCARQAPALVSDIAHDSPSAKRGVQLSFGQTKPARSVGPAAIISRHDA